MVTLTRRAACTMRTSRARRGVSASAAGVLVALALGACSTAATPTTPTTPTGSAGSGEHGDHGAPATSSAPATASSSPSAGDAAQAGDVTFAQQMIPHHEQAVEMADIALDKPSASAAVRRLATQMKAAQDSEIATMRGWLSAWGAPTAPPSPAATDSPATSGGGGDDAGHGGHGGHGDGMMSAQEMAALAEAEGAAFDRSWLTMMIEHHEGAVTMSQQVLETTRNPEVTTLAQAIISAQRDEIATMRGLLEAKPSS